MQRGTALVTGARTGMGYETAKALARRGYKVIMADKCDQTQSRREIVDSTGNDNVTCKTLHLGSFKSIRDFAERIKYGNKKLDVLINNAGIFCLDKKKTCDNLDGVMQVNHLGPLLLTHLLTDLLIKADGSRILFVTSQGAFFNNMTTERLTQPYYFFPHYLSGLIHYYNSKLCNMISAKMFARKLVDEKVTCNSVHPGMANTDFLVSGANSLKKALTRRVLKCTTKDVKDAAAAQVFLATSPTLKCVTGKYFAEYQVHQEPAVLQDETLVCEIWEESKRLVGI